MRVVDGHWNVMFPKSRIPNAAAVEAALRTIADGVKVEKRGPQEWGLVVDGKEFGVALNTSTYVEEESELSIAICGADVPKNADDVMTYDARYEIVYDLPDIGDLFDPILRTSEVLAELTGGTVYEVTNRRFHLD